MLRPAGRAENTKERRQKDEQKYCDWGSGLRSNCADWSDRKHEAGK